MPHMHGAPGRPKQELFSSVLTLALVHSAAVYFISPCERSVRALVEDFGGVQQMYKRAHVFFSNTVPKRLLNAIRNSAPLTERLVTLKEFNLEYTVLDSRSFVTQLISADPGSALGPGDDLSCFYSHGAHNLVTYEEGLSVIVDRLATMFASLRENPSIRFKAGRSSSDEEAAMREMLSGRLAGMLSERISGLAAKLSDFPQGETCDMLILDRGADAVAPLVHDWSYECLCHDLLRMRGGNVYKYKYQSNAGKTEEKDVFLDESDVLFRELRNLHVADVLIRVSERMEKFRTENKAAAKRGGGDASVSDIKKMVESLPQYREQLQKLSLHTTIAEEINAAIKLRRLNDVGKLEQELIFGDATSKDVLRLLEQIKPSGGTRAGALASEAQGSDRLRLLMCYFGTHAEKMDGEASIDKWKQAAALAPDDMGAILNLEMLGCTVMKRPAGAPKVKKTRRKAPPNEEGWDLPKFAPRLAELTADLVKGELSQEAFPYVNPPMDAGSAMRAATGVVPGRSARSAGTSVRSARPTAATAGGTGGGTWASKRDGGLAGAMGDLRLGASRARRLLLFIIGPVGYNELRVAHELSEQLGRDVFIGGTSFVSPDEFLLKIKGLRRGGVDGADDEEY
jgi:syntaxin-binding protein 1